MGRAEILLVVDVVVDVVEVTDVMDVVDVVVVLVVGARFRKIVVLLSLSISDCFSHLSMWY